MISVRKLLHFKFSFFYVLGVVIINYGYATLPNIHIATGEFSLGDVLTGCIYILRDFAQQEIGHGIIIAMLIGAFISYLLSDPLIASASFFAFIFAETFDWALFTFTKKPLSQRLLISSLLSTPLDSYVFLALIYRLNWLEFSMLTLAKFVGVFILWLVWRYKKNDSIL